jgi:hypothetical protein
MEAAMNTVKKPKAAKTTKPAKSKAPRHVPALADVDALLDEALNETFPASDPVALTQPSLRRRAELKRRTARRTGTGLPQA